MQTTLSRRSVLAGLASAAYVAAQSNRKSPHETVDLDVGGKKIEISYGRPSLKGRKAVGGDLAPYGQVWRLGADEATKLTLTADATVGTLKVPAGSYALFAVPGAKEWTIIVDKKADQWGAFSYEKSQDLGRFTAPAEKSGSPVETFTIKVEAQGSSAATVNMAWENTTVSFPVKFA